MVPVEGRGGGGVGAHAVEEVTAVLVHEVVDVNCFVLFFFFFFVFVSSLGGSLGGVDMDGDGYPHSSIVRLILRRKP